MAKKKIAVEELPTKENISIEAMDNIMGDRYAVYAKYVIQDRAIPDARDGLKPVQRRIIYSMFKNGNTYDKPTKKCAKIVGDVMGRFHPHGDSSIYDALVRLSQPWKMSSPLIQFQGNNGSIDNDPAAAYRYTEAKLNEFSQFLTQDIDKNTVDMALNFDDTELEPIVLPSRYPNLYVNGSEGIAVAIATDIPPHNLIEMCDATIYRMNHPKCSLDDLLEFVKGPDFPTGGIIFKSEGIKNIYETGKGKIELASKVEIIENNDYNELLITEIPYGVVKQNLVYSIDKIKKSKEIDGLLDVKDLSAGDDIKITVDVKKTIDPKIILAYLMNKTQLKVSYTSNCVAICQNHPRTMTLEFYLDTYIEHQIDVVTRYTTFDLNKAQSRLHIIKGLIKAINIIDEVVKIIRGSKDKGDSKHNLINAYKFSETQAEAIVMMPLYKLSNTDVNIYIKEQANLESQIKDLTETLNNPTKLKRIIIDELHDITKKYGVPRRSIIVDESPKIEIDKRDLIIKEDVYVVVTSDGYIKRSSIKSYNASDNSLPGVKVGDCVVMSQLCNTFDYLLCFTDKGNYFCLCVDQIQEGKRKDEGKHINYVCNLPLDESIIKCILVKDFNKKVNVVLVSANGQIKKSKLNDFYMDRCTKPNQCMRLLNDDTVVDACISNGDNDLMIITKKGYSTYFNESEVTCTGLKSSGVKAISTLRDSQVAVLLTYRKDEKGKIIIITREGCSRIYDINYNELTNRLGKNFVVFKSFKSSPHELVYCNKIIDKNEPMALNALMEDNSVISLNINDFHLTPLESYCKKNLDFSDKLTIKKIYFDTIQTVDQDTIEEKTHENFKPTDFFGEKEEKPTAKIEKPTETVSIFEKLGMEKKPGNKNSLKNEAKNNDEKKEDKNSNYEQISIFDDMGD